MPLYVRHLPGRCAGLVDRQGVPPNVVCFNPSKAGPYIYLRMTEHDAVSETNRILLFHEPTKKLAQVPYALEELHATVNLFRGLEDLRLAWHEGRVWFTATSTHASHHMTNEMVLGRLSEDASRVERFNVLDVGERPAKNVVPFVLDGAVALLDVFRSRIYHVRDAPGEPPQPDRFVVERERPLTWAAGEPGLYRGSTSPVHLHGSTWGCVVHDIVFDDGTDLQRRLAYLHHWLELDAARGVVTFVSAPFWVAHWGVEYVSGLELLPEGRVRLFVGLQDRDAVVCETTLFDLRVGK